eukprot:GHRQ01040121.1.p2 GENE.GHRQ01040121.1~~GHRQ01040121.1.p2  ORF type:complete len:171 (+),score=56.40 GHRQ01040121.1:41-553(+)
MFVLQDQLQDSILPLSNHEVLVPCTTVAPGTTRSDVFAACVAPCASRYQHLGDMMSLGATNAAVALPLQLPSELSASITASPLGPLLSLVGFKLGSGQQQQSAAVSSGEGVTLEGPLAQLLRRAAYLYRQPTNEQRLNVAASWVQQAADVAARLAAEVSANSSSSSGIRR